MMIQATILAIVLLAGYFVTVGTSLLLLLGLSSMSPGFAVAGGYVRSGYKWVQNLLWLLCTFAGGYVCALVAGAIYPWLAGAVLAGALIAVLWNNTWEARQRGLAHQLLMTVFSVCGVAAGYSFALR